MSNNKKEEYQARQKEWRDLSLNQLSSVNNTFTTIAIGFLAFVYDKEMVTGLQFDIMQADPKLTLIALSFMMLILSIVFGLLILLTRLYDFRISRHLALTRQRMIDKYPNEGLLPSNIDRNYNFCERLYCLWRIVFNTIGFITIDEIKTNNKTLVSRKFAKLQEFANILGSATWKWLKLQILLFLFSVVLFGIYVIK